MPAIFSQLEEATVCSRLGQQDSSVIFQQGPRRKAFRTENAVNWEMPDVIRNMSLIARHATADVIFTFFRCFKVCQSPSIDYTFFFRWFLLPPSGKGHKIWLFFLSFFAANAIAKGFSDKGSSCQIYQGGKKEEELLFSGIQEGEKRRKKDTIWFTCWPQTGFYFRPLSGIYPSSPPFSFSLCVCLESPSSLWVWGAKQDGIDPKRYIISDSVSGCVRGSEWTKLLQKPDEREGNSKFLIWHPRTTNPISSLPTCKFSPL